MMSDLEPLFRPFAHKSLRLANRIAMAPMTRLFAPDGVLIDEADEYYARRARGGTGLIISEGTAVGTDVSAFSKRVPYFHGQAPLERWRSVVAAVHREGGAFAPQLWHPGVQRRSHQTINPDTPSVSASDLSEAELTGDSNGGVRLHRTADRKPRPMTLDDIDETIAAFAASGRAARDIGCDAVEIHGAHGYLIDQFLWERSNRRGDAYGGSVENRLTFATRLVAAMRAAVGPDFTIIFRFSQWKTQDYNTKLAATPAELERFLVPLADAGVDIFHGSTRRFWEPEFDGSNLNAAGWAKKITGRPAMTVGSIGLAGTFEPGSFGQSTTDSSRLVALAEMIDRGDVDLAAVGRTLIANPEWTNLVREGAFDRMRAYNADAHVTTLEQVDPA